MTDNIKEIVRRPRRRLPEISLPDGDTAIPRLDFAHNVIGSCERSVARMGLPTIYIGGVAYVKREASLQIISDKATRRNPPTRRRRA
jgi:hypothetical protein